MKNKYFIILERENYLVFFLNYGEISPTDCHNTRTEIHLLGLEPFDTVLSTF